MDNFLMFCPLASALKGRLSTRGGVKMGVSPAGGVSRRRAGDAHEHQAPDDAQQTARGRSGQQRIVPQEFEYVLPFRAEGDRSQTGSRKGCCHLRRRSAQVDRSFGRRFYAWFNIWHRTRAGALIGSALQHRGERGARLADLARGRPPGQRFRPTTRRLCIET